MGNRHYESFDLSQNKRNWIAFYIGMQQLSEVIVLLNVLYLLFFEYKIILPIIMIATIIFKKWLYISFDHRYEEYASEQDSCLSLIGFTPAVITDQYVRFRHLEFIIHYFVSLTQIYYIVIYGDDRLCFMMAFVLGFISVFALTNQDNNFKYGNNFILFIQSLEQSIGCILNASFILLCLKIGWVGIIFYIAALSIEICLLYKQQVLQFEEIFIHQICGYTQIKLRDKNYSRIYNQTNISSKNIYPFATLIQILLLAIIDFFFNDQLNLIILRKFLYCLILVYLPAIVYITQQFMDYLNYGSNIKNIVIYNQEINELDDQQIVLKFTKFQEHESVINYEIYEIEFEKIQIIFNQILKDNQRLFNAKVYYQQLENIFSIIVSSEKVMFLINYKDIQFLEMICKSIVETDCCLKQYKLQISNSSNELHKDLLKPFFLRFYKLCNWRIVFVEQNAHLTPIQNERIYQKLVIQLKAFDLHISDKLVTNPHQVLYDLYENL